LWWSGPTDTGGIGISNPAAGSTSDWFAGTQPNVVVIGLDRALYQWNGYYGWERIGGYFQGNPAMVASHDSSSGDRLDVACVGGDSNHNVYHAAWYTYDWQGWTELFYDGVFGLYKPCGDPCLLAGYSARNRLDCFANCIWDGDQCPVHDGFDGNYWWVSDGLFLPGWIIPAGAPAAAYDNLGNICWFVRDVYGNLWERNYIW
jgi:hypothetical protein